MTTEAPPSPLSAWNRLHICPPAACRRAARGGAALAWARGGGRHTAQGPHPPRRTGQGPQCTGLQPAVGVKCRRLWFVPDDCSRGHPMWTSSGERCASTRTRTHAHGRRGGGEPLPRGPLYCSRGLTGPLHVAPDTIIKGDVGRREGVALDGGEAVRTARGQTQGGVRTRAGPLPPAGSARRQLHRSLSPQAPARPCPAPGSVQSQGTWW